MLGQRLYNILQCGMYPAKGDSTCFSMVCLNLVARLTLNRFEIHMEMVCCMQKQTGLLLRYRKVEASLFCLFGSCFVWLFFWFGSFVFLFLFCVCMWIIKEKTGIFKENFLPGIEIWNSRKCCLERFERVLSLLFLISWIDIELEE